MWTLAQTHAHFMRTLPQTQSILHMNQEIMQSICFVKDKTSRLSACTCMFLVVLDAQQTKMTWDLGQRNILLRQTHKLLCDYDRSIYELNYLLTY